MSRAKAVQLQLAETADAEPSGQIAATNGTAPAKRKKPKAGDAMPTKLGGRARANASKANGTPKSDGAGASGKKVPDGTASSAGEPSVASPSPTAVESRPTPAPASQMALTVESAFRRVAERRGRPPEELFTDVLDTGLVNPAADGNSWAVKLLVDELRGGAPDDEPDEPVSPAAGLMIYEILRAERGG